MKKTRAAVVGYGNIGRYVVEALQTAPDFEIAGIVRRDVNHIPEELKNYKVVSDLGELEGVEVAILCTPTRSVEAYASKALSLGINTVDSFDIHTGTVDLHRKLNEVSRQHNAVAIMSAGWDPAFLVPISQVISGNTSKGLNTSYPRALIKGMMKAFLVASSV